MVLLYADDLKMYFPVRSSKDSLRLQGFLSVFNLWCSLNCLSLNVSKCSVISFTRARTPLWFNYVLSDTSLPRSETARDLGIILDTKLYLDKQFDDVIARANRTLLKITLLLPCSSFD